MNPPETSPPVAVTHYLTPGLTLLGSPTAGPGRGLYVDTSGQLYAVVGSTVYSVSSSWAFTSIGNISTSGASPVCMVDNETIVFLVDGTTSGYTFPVGGGALTHVIDSNFLGSQRIDFLNTYFLFAQPGTPNFYTSLSNTATFSALYFTAITGQPSDLVAAIALHGVVWLIGKTASEIWLDSGATNVLPFERVQNMSLHQGCEAPYSIARMSGDDDTQTALFWLGASKDGAGTVMMAQGYALKRVSTHAIEQQFLEYTTRSDAIGFCYQQDGHCFYQLSFPTADATWCYDLTTNQWHQRAWADSNGILHRSRALYQAYAYNTNVVQDWETGALYEYDLNNYTDNGAPIVRVRTFPHLVNGLNRVEYSRFIADISCGQGGTSPDIDPLVLGPRVSLRYSDDRGNTWTSPTTRSMGAIGEYKTTPTWLRLGRARDRVFELSWSEPQATALNGAYVEPVPLTS